MRYSVAILTDDPSPDNVASMMAPFELTHRLPPEGQVERVWAWDWYCIQSTTLLKDVENIEDVRGTGHHRVATCAFITPDGEWVEIDDADIPTTFYRKWDLMLKEVDMDNIFLVITRCHC